MSQINVLAEDQPGTKQKLQTFRVRFKTVDKDGVNSPDLDVTGYGLRVENDMVEILGATDIVAAFPKSEIVGVWPLSPTTTS